MTTVRIVDPDDLSTLADLIHDRWFDLESVVVDRDAGEIRVPLVDRRPGSGSVRRLLSRSNEASAVAELVVAAVRDCSIDDQAEIRWFDVNELRYDEPAQRVSIDSNFPLTIVATVENLDVTVTTF